MQISSFSRREVSNAFEPDRDEECSRTAQTARGREALNRAPEHVANAESVARARTDDIPLPNRNPLDFDVPPQQDHSTSAPILLADASDVLPIQATATDALPPPVAPEKRATFKNGSIVAPRIRHDHGFLGKGLDRGELDESKRREPTFSDRAALAAWVSKLRGAQMLRPDLKEACAAYEHYLFGKGAPFVVDYDRFLINDPSGRTVLQSALEDARIGAALLHDRAMRMTPPGARTDSFTMVSDVVVVGDTDNRYPYPATENWQKAMGGHAIWIETRVNVVSDPAAQRRRFDIDFAIHGEDMYNFDPKKEDIATGTPDEANGRFQESGLANEFLTTGTATRKIQFSLPLDTSDPHAMPADLVVMGGPRPRPAPAPGSSPPPPHPPQ
ncbi:MAG: hypothetical protein ABW133_10615 [Polyangiaceae bacterium]